jgi:hypothetical protein
MEWLHGIVAWKGCNGTVAWIGRMVAWIGRMKRRMEWLPGTVVGNFCIEWLQGTNRCMADCMGLYWNVA